MSKNADERILDFYKTQGIRTKVRKGTFDDFPESIADICKTIQYLLIHPAHLYLFGLKMPRERINDKCKSTIQESLDQVKKFKNKPLIEYREPSDRVVNTCRQYAMFMCSVLRERGIPARCRCGFATYFSNGWFEDHWICEYWNKKENKWIRVDAQIDDIQILECHIDRENINFTNLPKEAFFTAGVLWKLYRQGLVGGELCGYSVEEGQNGAWYIRGNMLRDFFALNKVEYRYQELTELMDRDYKPDEKELLLLDEIADLTINIDKRFDEFISFHKNNKHLNPK
jgi:hypothetical protein